jgi:hypothetical protein
MDLSVFSFIAFFSLILSILYSRAYKKIERTSCPDNLQKKMRGFTFCIQCGEVLRLPSKKMFQRDILVMLLMAFLILTTLVIQVPIFSIYSDEPTIWHSSLYGYEDRGLFDTSGYLGSDRILDSQYISYYIENMGANATLIISVGNVSFVDEEFKVIQSDKIVAPFETMVKSPVSKYTLIDNEGKTSLIAYWSVETSFIYESGFKSKDLSFIMQTPGNSTNSINLLEETSTELVSSWSEAQRNSQDLNRFWIFYRRVSDFIPLIPVSIILFSISNKTTKKDYEVELRTENALNLERNEKLLLASLVTASSKNGSATGIEVETLFRKTSNSEKSQESIFNKLEKLYEMDLVEPVITTNSMYPIIKWKPKFPSAL